MTPRLPRHSDAVWIGALREPGEGSEVLVRELEAYLCRVLRATLSELRP